MSDPLQQAIEYCQAEGIPLEELEIVYEEEEIRIDDIELMLPPGVRSVAELEDINAGVATPMIWTPETAHLFED